MSKSSIYESGWLNLVFEGKNKEYGAYQLRQESGKTTFFAFILGLLCVSTFAIVMLLVTSNSAAAVPTNPEYLGPVIHLDKFKPNTPPVKKPEVPLKKTEPLKEPDPKLPLSNPIIVAKDPDNVAPNKEPVATPSENGSDNGTATPNTGGETGTPSAPTVTPTMPDNGTTVVTTNLVDVMPEFPGGINRFLAYVGQNFEKPENIDTTVTIFMLFVVEKDGSMSDIKVLRNPGYGLDKEAIRVLKAQKTKWKPGIKDGKPVRVLYTLPIKVTAVN